MKINIKKPKKKSNKKELDDVESNWVELGQNFAKVINSSLKNPKITTYSYRYRSSFFWPLLLLFIGVFWLLRSIGYISADFPFWPSLLIIVSVAWLLRRVFRFSHF